MKVNIKNYQAIKEATLEFLPGITVIVGSSNNGKSSIIRAIQGAINNQGGNKFINYDADSCEATIEDLGHKVVWKKSKKQGKSAYIIDGQELSKIGQKQIEDVANVLNMREIEINNEKVRINFWKQLDYPFMVGKNPYQLFDFISRSKEQEAIANLESSLVTDKKTASSAVAYSIAQIDNVSKTLNGLESELKLLEPFTLLNVDLINRRIAAYESTLKSLEDIATNVHLHLIALEKFAKLKPIVEGTTDLMVQIQKNISSLESFSQTLNTIKAKEATLQKTKEAKASLESKVKNTESTLLSLKTIMESIDTNNKRMDTIKDLKLAVDRNTVALLNSKKQIESFKTLKETYESELSKFEFCPMCNQPLKNHEVKHG